MSPESEEHGYVIIRVCVALVPVIGHIRSSNYFTSELMLVNDVK